MTVQRLVSWCSVALVLVLAACGAANKKDSSGGGMELPLERIYDQLLAQDPTGSAALGYHEFDGKLPTVAKADVEARIASLREMENELASSVPATLELDRQILLTEVRSRRFYLEEMRRPWRDPLYYLSPLSLSNYVSRAYAPAPVRAQAVIELAKSTPLFLSVAEGNLEEKLPKTWVATGLLVARGLIQFAKDDVKPKLGNLDASTRRNVEAALGEYVGALEAHVRFLEDRNKVANDDFRLGPERYQRMLEMTEGVSISLERLREIARVDLERNSKALIDAALELAPSSTTKQAVEQVRADRPAVEAVLDTAREQSDRMKKFLIDKQIVSIPSADEVLVRDTPPFMRWNFAFLSSAGIFETHKLPSFYYISPPNPAWPAVQQREYVSSRSDLLFVTVHEVWPGHFLHSLHAKRHPSKVAKSFCSYAMSEGWAHYTEEMMWDQGVSDAPADHIGQLQNALLRNVRFVASLGLHTGSMTVEEAERLFVDKGFQDQATARQQAVRGTFDPGYLNYTLGKLMIRKLHDDWKKAQGPKYSLKAFHDRFLSHACAPIPVIRRAMLGDQAGPVL